MGCWRPSPTNGGWVIRFCQKKNVVGAADTLGRPHLHPFAHWVLRVPAGICVTLVGSASPWARKHRWVSDDMRRLIAIWDGPAANSCRAWHGLSSTRSQQINGLDRLMMVQTWQAKDAYGVLWSCSSFFFYLFVCHICLIERLSAHHIVHSSTGVFLDGWGVNLWGTSQHLLHGWSNHSEGHGFSLIMSESVIIQLQSSGWDRKPICSCTKLFFVVKKPPWAQNGTVACYMVAG